MRRLGLGVAAVAVAAVSLFGLREATQNRPDPVREGTATELTLQVRTRGGYPAVLGAHGLWGLCQQTVSQARLRAPVTEVGEGRFTFVVEPALGTHAGRRLRGCLEDATVPRVSADLVAERHLVVG